jgi:hypothetical protein
MTSFPRAKGKSPTKRASYRPSQSPRSRSTPPKAQITAVEFELALKGVVKAQEASRAAAISSIVRGGFGDHSPFQRRTFSKAIPGEETKQEKAMVGLLMGDLCSLKLEGANESASRLCLNLFDI